VLCAFKDDIVDSLIEEEVIKASLTKLRAP
jgi:hypothetical protein